MCDCLVALPPATDGATTLFAKNSDRPPGEAQDVVWSPPRRDTELHATHVAVEPWGRQTLGCVLSRPRWCWGAEHGVNEAGVAIGNEAIYTTLDPRNATPALIGMDLVRLGLERAASAREAVAAIVELLERYGQGGSGHDPAGPSRPYWSSFLVADPAAAFVVETSGREHAIEQVGRARAISNRTTIPDFDARHRHPHQPVEQLVDPRWQASTAVLAAEPVTVDALEAHLRSHGSCTEAGWSVCMHVPGVEATAASVIAELRSDGMHRCRFLLGHPCEEAWTPIDVDALVGSPARTLLAWEGRAGRAAERTMTVRARVPPRRPRRCAPARGRSRRRG